MASCDDDKDDVTTDNVTTDDDITEDEPSCGESEKPTFQDRLQNRQLGNKTKKQERGEVHIDRRGVSTLDNFTVWCVGEKCEAPFAGDAEYYGAVINSLCNNEQEAEVTFIGYESDGRTTVPIRNLRKTRSQKKKTASVVDFGEASDWKESLFCPLNGTEVEEEMRQKYGVSEFDDDEFGIKEVEKDDVPQPKGKSSFRKKKGKLPVTLKSAVRSHRKGIFVKDTVKSNNREQEVSREITENLGMTNCTATSRLTPNIEEKDMEDLDIADMMADGFDDEDMERPRFSDTTPDLSEPLVLSDPDMNPKVQVPATINRYLRDYQRDGVRFLYRHYTANTGAILGDDMGLGKTVQVISFIAAVLGKTGTKIDLFGKFLEKDAKSKKVMEGIVRERGTFLIVSPSSIVYNWSDELEAWGYFKQDKFHGNKKESVLERVSRGSLDVVVTTYETLRNHLSDLNKVQWLAVIMDEVHRLKESKTHVTKAAKALRVRRRYGLTGTPLQNRISEFWCVLDWANPGCLGTAKLFNKAFGKPIKRGQKFDANKRELATGRKKSRLFQAKLNEWFLRRTKEIIADQMPRKDEKVVFCALAPFQEEVYRTLLDMPDVDLLRKKDYPCDCGSGEGRGKCCHGVNSEGEELKPLLLRYLNLLLKVANHSALLMPQIKQTDDQRRRAKAICDKVFQRYPEFAEAARCGSLETLSDPRYSGKMKVLDRLMRVFEAVQSKVLVFSNSTELLNILELYATGRGLVYNRLDGTTRMNQRTQIVRDFNKDPQISLCLVSTPAGCLGLNFTGANVVVIFDPSWNPSRDLQAQDRAYRIGQRRDVLVYRLVSTGTIEELIYLRQVYKQQLSNIAIGGINERRYFMGVQGDKDQKGELFGIENLFELRSEGASLAHDIVKRTEKIEAGFKVANYDVVPPVGAEQQDRETGHEEELQESKTCDDPYDLDDIASQYVGNASPSQEPGPSTSRSSKERHRDAYLDPNLSSASDTSEQEHYSGEDESPSSSSASESNREEHEVTHNSDSLNELEHLERWNEDNPRTSAPRGILDARINSSEEEDKHTSNQLQPKGCAVSAKRNKVVFHELFTSSSEEDESNCGLESIVMDEPYTKIKCKNLIEEFKANQNTKTSDVSKRGRTRKSYNTRKIFTNSAASRGENVDSGEDNEDYNKAIIVKRKRKGSSEISSNHCVSKRFQSRLKTWNHSKTKKERPFSQTDPKRKLFEKDSPPKRGKSTTVEDVFRECGVSYVHANRAIVGPSDAENCMSSLAIKEVFDLNLGSQQPANCFMALQESDESDDVGGGTAQRDDESRKKVKRNVEAHESVRKCGASQRKTKDTSTVTKSEKLNENAVFIGNVPRGIRRQHFREMRRVLGFSSEVDLADAVLRSDVEERRSMLKRYYIGKNQQLETLPSFNKAFGNDNNNKPSTSDEAKGEIEGEQCDKSRRKRSQQKEKLQNEGKNKKCKISKHYCKADAKANIKYIANNTKENGVSDASKAPVGRETFTSASNVKQEGVILEEKVVTRNGSSVTREGSAVTRGGLAVTRECSAVTRGGSAVTREGSAVTRGGSAVTREGSAVTREGLAVTWEGSADADETFSESRFLLSDHFHSQLVPRDAGRPSQSRSSSILDDLLNLGDTTDRECAGANDYTVDEECLQTERTESEVLRARVHRRLNITSVLDDFI